MRTDPRDVSIGMILGPFPDRPGALADVTEYLNENGINVSNAYGFILEAGERAVLILEVDDFDRAEKVIRQGGFHTLTPEELQGL